jgi:hypothetical protein
MDANGDVGWEAPAASGAALTGSTDNTVVTVTGANAIAGEADLTFDGSKLEVKTSAATANDLINAINVNARTTGTAAAGVGTKMTFYGSMTGQDNVELGQIGFHNTNVSGAHGDFVVKTRPNGTSVERLRVDSGGNVKVNDGDLVIGTAGHGIDFSAASDSASGETVSSSLLDDYEEGTFTSSIVSSNMTLDDSSATGHYVKIGRVVHACGTLSLNTNDGSPAVSGSDNITQSLPFQPRSTNAAMTGTIFQQNINAGPGTSVSHPHYYNIFPCDYLCYPASDGVRFYINKIEYSYERMTNSHMSAGFPGYTWMSWSITYQTSQ